MSSYDKEGLTPPRRRRSSASEAPQSSRRARAADFMEVDQDERSGAPAKTSYSKSSHGESRRSRSPRSPRKRARHASPARAPSSDSSATRTQRRDRSRDRRSTGDGKGDRPSKRTEDRGERRRREKDPDDRRDDGGRSRHPRARQDSQDGSGAEDRHSGSRRDGNRRRSRSRDRRDADPERSHRRRRYGSQSASPSHKHRRHRRDDEERDRRHHRSKRHRDSPSPPSSVEPQAPMRARGPLPSQQDTFTGELSRQDPTGASAPPIEKERPNYERSGKLAAETNTVAGTGVVLKYNEPPEARLPPAKADWRLFEFKGEETMSTTVLSERSCWLFGREKAVADFPILHPSCSSQHAVLQFRHVEKKNEFGDNIGRVRLYLLDLQSANGTFLNDDRIEDRRYFEVRKGDVIKFGESTREYVLMLA